MRPDVSRIGCLREVAAVFAAIFLVAPGPARPEAPDDQSGLVPLLNHGGNELRFDWPILSIGTGEYAEGPTGVTVFRFARKVTAVMDVRGEPGAANTEFLRLGRDNPIIDAIVLSGGSAYGLESTTAVMTALKDDHVRTGTCGDIGLVSGAIIWTSGTRRLNEVYPDKRLAQARIARRSRACSVRVRRVPVGWRSVAWASAAARTRGRVARSFSRRSQDCRLHGGEPARPRHGPRRPGPDPVQRPALKGLSTSEVLAKSAAMVPGGDAQTATVHEHHHQPRRREPEDELRRPPAARRPGPHLDGPRHPAVRDGVRRRHPLRRLDERVGTAEGGQGSSGTPHAHPDRRLRADVGRDPHRAARAPARAGARGGPGADADEARR